MAKFAFMLNHAPDRYSGLSEDDYMTIIKDYLAWVDKATAQGVYLGGHKLTAEPGRTLEKSGDEIEVHDSPFAELPEILGGLMIVRADDYDSAVEIAKAHPHLVHNCSLEIREIDDVE